MERSSSSHTRCHRARLRQKLHRIRRWCSFTSKHSTSPSAFKLVSADDFAGIALLTLISAEMKFKDRWMACVSLGEQTFRTDISGLKTASCLVLPGKIIPGHYMAVSLILDYNEDGLLSFSEFSDLIDAFGNEVATHKKEELFQAADTNGDGVVSMDELAALLVLQQEKEPLINSCPVCGKILDASNMLGSMIHMTLCFNEGTGNSVMSGVFLTEKQASLGWLFKLSEWAHFSSYGVGLNKGSKTAHILVFDRSTKRLVEELFSGKIILSMRAIYQSKLGLHLMDKGAKELLQDISEKQGRKMNSVDSVKDIPKFISFFKTFNEFFIRELKPGARCIACMDRDDVAVCAADCRLTAFRTVRESTRFWVKFF